MSTTCKDKSIRFYKNNHFLVTLHHCSLLECYHVSCHPNWPCQELWWWIPLSSLPTWKQETDSTIFRKWSMDGSSWLIVINDHGLWWLTMVDNFGSDGWYWLSEINWWIVKSMAHQRSSSLFRINFTSTDCFVGESHNDESDCRRILDSRCPRVNNDPPLLLIVLPYQGSVLNIVKLY